MNKSVVPEDASKREISIHKFLEDMKVNEVNVKEMLEDQNRVHSPEVKKAFDDLRTS